MTNQPRQVVFRHEPERVLASIRKPAQDAIRTAIRELADDPHLPDSEPMIGKAEGLHRLRVGEYRIVYRLVDEPLKARVIRIGHRDHVYEGYEHDPKPQR